MLLLMRAWIAAAFVIGCTGYLAVPWARVTLTLVPVAARAARAEASPREVTLLWANLMMHNRDIDAFLALLDRESPDALALQEVPAHWREPLHDLADVYPHGIVFPEPSDPRRAT